MFLRLCADSARPIAAPQLPSTASKLSAPRRHFSLIAQLLRPVKRFGHRSSSAGPLVKHVLPQDLTPRPLPTAVLSSLSAISEAGVGRRFHAKPGAIVAGGNRPIAVPDVRRPPILRVADIASSTGVSSSLALFLKVWRGRQQTLAAGSDMRPVAASDAGVGASAYSFGEIHSRAWSPFLVICVPADDIWTLDLSGPIPLGSKLY